MAPIWSFICDLDDSKKTFAMKVRLIRSYGFPSYNNREEINSWECVFHDLRGDRIEATIPKNLIPTFKDQLHEGSVYGMKNFKKSNYAAYALGLLDDDKEYIDGIMEASQWASANFLRNLFATLLSSDSLARPEVIWDKCWSLLSNDILYNQRILLQHPELLLSEDQIKSYALVEIEKFLRTIGRSLRDFPTMPFPNIEFFQFNGNRLIIDELRYDRISLHQEYQDFLRKCTDEQRRVHDAVLNATESDCGGMFFVYGYGGTGKTFVWKGLSAALWSRGEIVINVASSRIASLLLPGGRIAHSRFKIPINANEDSTCNIKQGSPLAELLIKAKLIIWDEAPMMHKFCFEALDRSLRDIMRFCNPLSFNYPFGGKTVFTHGQLYVAMSRVTSRSGLRILLCGNDDVDSTSTTNVVYKEVFRNL